MFIKMKTFDSDFDGWKPEGSFGDTESWILVTFLLFAVFTKFDKSNFPRQERESRFFPLNCRLRIKKMSIETLMEEIRPSIPNKIGFK